MKTARPMQDMITQLAQHHNFDLTQPGTHLKLYVENFMPLVIERLNSTPQRSPLLHPKRRPHRRS
jgi:hypothetical protein